MIWAVFGLATGFFQVRDWNGIPWEAGSLGDLRKGMAMAGGLVGIIWLAIAIAVFAGAFCDVTIIWLTVVVAIDFASIRRTVIIAIDLTVIGNAVAVAIDSGSLQRFPFHVRQFASPRLPHLGKYGHKGLVLETLHSFHFKSHVV